MLLLATLPSCQSSKLHPNAEILSAYQEGCDRAVVSGYRTEWECREILSVRAREFPVPPDSESLYIQSMPSTPMLIINGISGGGMTIMEVR